MLATKILRYVFGARNNAREAKAGLGVSGDVISEIFGVRRIADDDGFKSGTTIMLEGDTARNANGLAEQTEEDKARDHGIESHDANWKKIDVEEKIIGNNRHDADD